MDLKAGFLDRAEVREAIALAFREDRASDDITTEASGLGDRPAHARIIAKAPTVAAGGPLVPMVLATAQELLPTAPIAWTVNGQDGTLLAKGAEWIRLEGRAADILRVERTLLNFLMRMCGIATATRTVVDAIADTGCKVLHTRKTAPGLRYPDIYAALCGGAVAHRQSLGDAVLVKENHLRATANWQHLFDGIEKVRGRASFIEIEVTNLMELKHALPARPDRIMLDNFSPEECAKAAMLFGSATQLEASGGINLSNAKAYAETGVDFISMGWITHSAPAADLSLLFEV
jgi:nicotinate-nucleotide pyrophosphorylase (carboxylating)